MVFLVLGPVDALWVVFLEELLKIVIIIGAQVGDDLVGIAALDICALGAVRLKSIGQQAFQLTALWRAGSCLHQTLDVIAQNATIAQDIVHIDIVELIGVFPLGTGSCQADKHTNNQYGQRSFHFVRLKTNIQKNNIINITNIINASNCKKKIEPFFTASDVSEYLCVCVTNKQVQL